MTTSQVLYRKWRPARFVDVVGQEHITHTLRQAVKTNRVAHAYLFTGPRGVGKTSTARILAKSLNVGLDETGEPIINSQISNAIDRGSHLDLIEIDGASNRRIDDIRKIRTGVQFQPVSGNWKVYIIDEVHMLTEPAFNALLKTLEEPPPHVVIILATTDVQKVPATIISRCQRFDFRRLSIDVIIDRLADICGEEDIDCQPEVLNIIAQASWGSLRDAENLLEQLTVSHFGKKESEITAEAARSLLGLGDKESATNLAAALISGDSSSALSIINDQVRTGADLKSLKNGTVDTLRTSLLEKAGVKGIAGQSSTNDLVKSVARGVAIEKLLFLLASIGEVDIKNEGSPLDLEIAVIKGIYSSNEVGTTNNVPQSLDSKSVSNQKESGPKKERVPKKEPTSKKTNNFDKTISSQQIEDSQTANSKPNITADQARWQKVTWELRRTKFRRWVLGPILRNVDTPIIENETITLRFKSRSMRDRFTEETEDPRAREAVRSAIATEYGDEITLKISSPTDEESQNPETGKGTMESPLIRAAMAYGARVVEQKDSPESSHP